MNYIRLTRGLSLNILVKSNKINSFNAAYRIPHMTRRHPNFVTPVIVNRQISSSIKINNANAADEEHHSTAVVDNATYLRICAETLDALCDYFENLIENATDLSGTDVAYGDGVLTVKLGEKHGTYVINRQTPNKQIWLSSPTSGPKRFDFVGNDSAGKWIYKHTGQSLHNLLQNEISSIIKDQKVDFCELPYGS